MGNLLRHVYGKYVWIIGLKAPGNDLDQCWFNKISVLLCEGPKTSKCHDFWILEPQGTLIYEFEYAKNTLKNEGNIWKDFRRMFLGSVRI